MARQSLATSAARATAPANTEESARTRRLSPLGLEGLKPPPLDYCDYIAHRIGAALSANDPEGILQSPGRIASDLHPQGGWMLSTKKTLGIVDRNGRAYRITIEAVGP